LLVPRCKGTDPLKEKERAATLGMKAGLKPDTIKRKAEGGLQTLGYMGSH